MLVAHASDICCCTAGRFKTAILDGDVAVVREILDDNPDFVDDKFDVGYPHQIAMDHHQLEVAICLQDEHNCTYTHNKDPHAVSAQEAAEQHRDRERKGEELERKRAAGLMGPPPDTPIYYALQFISDVEGEIDKHEHAEYARITGLGLWCEYFYGKNHALESLDFQKAMKLLKRMKVVLIGTTGYTNEYLSGSNAYEYIYWWKEFIQTVDLKIMKVANEELMRLCSSYNALMGSDALVVPAQMLP